MKIKCENPEEVVKAAFWLAYLACGRTSGMGFLQDHPSATPHDVWQNVIKRGDYPGGPSVVGPGVKPGEAYGDYVFGRMMKLRLTWDEEGVSADGNGPRLDYQGWSAVYPSYTELIQAAIKYLEG